MTQLSGKRIVTTVAVCIALFIAGVAAFKVVGDRISDRVENGQARPGRVVEVGGWRYLESMLVRYEHEGQTYEARLRDLGGLISEYSSGDKVIVYLDRSDPTRVAIVDRWYYLGYSNESAWLINLPVLLWSIGFGALMLLGVRIGRYLRAFSGFPHKDLVLFLSSRLTSDPTRDDRVVGQLYRDTNKGADKWRSAYGRLQRGIRAENSAKDVHGGLRLHVIFHVARGRLQPGSNEVTIGRYSSKLNLLLVQVTLPPKPDRDADEFLRVKLSEAVDAAQRHAIDRGLSSDLSEVRRILHASHDR